MVWLLVFSATFNHISVISRTWRSVLINGGNRNTRRKPPTCRKSLTNGVRTHTFRQWLKQPCDYGHDGPDSPLEDNYVLPFLSSVMFFCISKHSTHITRGIEREAVFSTVSQTYVTNQIHMHNLSSNLPQELGSL